MNPAMIIAIVQGAIPLLEMFVSVGMEIAKQIEAMQALGGASAAALPGLTAIQTSHADALTEAVAALLKAISPPALTA